MIKLIPLTEKFEKKISNILFYKNPTTLYRYPDYCRGVILKNGDLYIGVGFKYQITHSEMLKAGTEFFGPYDSNWWARWNNKYLCVQRNGSESELFISESYIDYKPEYGQKIITAFYKKNPGSAIDIDNTIKQSPY